MENKLQPEEIAKIKDFRQTTDQLIISFGEIEFEMQVLNMRKEEQQKKLVLLKANQDVYSKVLFEKYGNVRINFETGDIMKSE
jgi:hypothetical protein